MSEPSKCATCQKQVEPEREFYAIPTCFACVPPPKPLPINYPKSLRMLMKLDFKETKKLCAGDIVEVRDINNHWMTGTVQDYPRLSIDKYCLVFNVKNREEEEGDGIYLICINQDGQGSEIRLIDAIGQRTKRVPAPGQTFTIGNTNETRVCEHVRPDEWVTDTLGVHHALAHVRCIPVETEQTVIQYTQRPEYAFIGSPDGTVVTRREKCYERVNGRWVVEDGFDRDGVHRVTGCRGVKNLDGLVGMQIFPATLEDAINSGELDRRG